MSDSRHGGNKEIFMALLITFDKTEIMACVLKVSLDSLYGKVSSDDPTAEK